MGKLRFFILVVLFASVGCRQPLHTAPSKRETNSFKSGEGALLLTRFKSLEDLKKVIQIQYGVTVPFSTGALTPQPYVRLTHSCGEREVTSILKTGVNESDFLRARNGNVWDKILLLLKSPFAVWNKRDLMIIESLGRKRPPLFGKGDVAFFDVAAAMVYNISDDDVKSMSSEDFSEKGYLNTFNHITAQAIMTSIFSEEVADFVADVHERNRLPELITGTFNEDELTDVENGPVDNYIDLINNEWGQELGKILRIKFGISHHSIWTPQLLADYLNEVQSYYSWSFQIAFKPFRATDEIVIQLASKINIVLVDVPEIKKS
ncbi:MAG: hypothetical protein IPP15_01570 [Saprospiraceae bacterium]|uniref:Uncharacterized protein n=1 Tax=Candidatus Opimibacter skivensis TaxID=2982028 RepID=A0A9D7SSC5_9BACT|nr:hypothetical protein [Candidatus Opimibacter skivensis]